jgi:hypothetical protein|nr:MAG TPA: hypothetical protein [Caudoviricetes sp.]
MNDNADKAPNPAMTLARRAVWGLAQESLPRAPKGLRPIHVAERKAVGGWGATIVADGLKAPLARVSYRSGKWTVQGHRAKSVTTLSRYEAEKRLLACLVAQHGRASAR